GLAVRGGDGAQDALDAGRDALLVGGALQDGRLDAGAGDAFGDVAYKHVGHEFGAAEFGVRPLEVKVHRHFVVGVDARGGDDVESGRAGDALDARDVAAEPDDRQVNDGIDAARLQLV